MVGNENDIPKLFAHEKEDTRIGIPHLKDMFIKPMGLTESLNIEDDMPVVNTLEQSFWRSAGIRLYTGEESLTNWDAELVQDVCYFE